MTANFDDFRGWLSSSVLFLKWRVANPGESQRLTSFMDAVAVGGVPAIPEMATSTGKALVSATRIEMEVQELRRKPKPVPVPPPPLSSGGIYWGARIDGDVYGRAGDAPWDQTTWDLFEQHAGKKVCVVEMGQPFCNFNQGPLDAASARGAFVLLTMGNKDQSGREWSLGEIAMGQADASLIIPWADKVKAYGRPIMLRPFWEFNGNWNPPWDWQVAGGTEPAVFVRAWQHFREVCDRRGATNLTWAWCPNIWQSSGQPVADPRAQWPGPDFVDWLAVDGYRFGSETVNEVFKHSYEGLLALADKPIVICETASAENSGKPAWITDLLGAGLQTRFPKVKAVCYFNWGIVESGVTRSWQIESSDAAKTAFRSGIASDYFKSAPAGGFASGQKVPVPT